MTKAQMMGEAAFWSTFGNPRTARQGIYTAHVDPGGQSQTRYQVLVVDEVEIIDPITKAVTKKPLVRVPR